VPGGKKILGKSIMVVLALAVGIGHPGAASAEALPPQAASETSVAKRLSDEVAAIYANRSTGPELPADAISAAPDQQKVAKQWGFYAHLAGTDWREGDMLVSYRWKDYGRDYVVITRRKGDVRIERIVPDRWGKKLIDMIFFPNGSVDAALLTVANDKIVGDMVARGSPLIDVWTMNGNAQHEENFGGRNNKESLGASDRTLIDSAAADALVAANPTPNSLARR
jgi:hypothetical protein